jgi:hypothetical protein
VISVETKPHRVVLVGEEFNCFRGFGFVIGIVFVPLPGAAAKVRPLRREVQEPGGAGSLLERPASGYPGGGLDDIFEFGSLEAKALTLDDVIRICQQRCVDAEQRRAGTVPRRRDDGELDVEAVSKKLSQGTETASYLSVSIDFVHDRDLPHFIFIVTLHNT